MTDKPDDRPPVTLHGLTVPAHIADMVPGQLPLDTVPGPADLEAELERIRREMDRTQALRTEYTVRALDRIAASTADRAGVVVVDTDGDTVLELDELAAALVALDRYHSAWRDYEQARPAPSDDTRYDAWEAAGPKPGHPLTSAIAPMSRTEVSRLRL